MNQKLKMSFNQSQSFIRLFLIILIRVCLLKEVLLKKSGIPLMACGNSEIISKCLLDQCPNNICVLLSFSFKLPNNAV